MGPGFRWDDNPNGGLPLILLPGCAETDRRPFPDRGAQIPGIAGEEDRDAVMVVSEGGAILGAETIKLGGLGVGAAQAIRIKAPIVLNIRIALSRGTSAIS